MYVRCHRYEVDTPHFAQIKWGGTCIPIITSHHVIERALKVALGCGPIYVPSIVDFDAFPLAKPEPADALRLAVVGYFSGRKQPALAFEASRALAYNWQIELSMVGKNAGGEPWWEDYLHAQPATDFLAVLHPWTDDVKGIWKLNDACLSTSAEEGCPYNVIEAMASGVPAFVHRYPGAEAQFPEEFVWTTLEELTDKVDRQFGSSYAWSPEAIRAWAAARYSIEGNREKVLDLFKAD